MNSQSSQVRGICCSPPPYLKVLCSRFRPVSHVISLMNIPLLSFAPGTSPQCLASEQLICIIRDISTRLKDYSCYGCWKYREDTESFIPYQWVTQSRPHLLVDTLTPVIRSERLVLAESVRLSIQLPAKAWNLLWRNPAVSVRSEKYRSSITLTSRQCYCCCHHIVLKKHKTKKTVRWQFELSATSEFSLGVFES